MTIGRHERLVRRPFQAVAVTAWKGRPTTSSVVLAVLLTSLLAVFTGCASSPDVDVVRKYQQSLDAFDQANSPADYLRSTALYQELLDKGIVSGGLLYNQGNAYMRAGQRGRAIACYRQALAYRPRDPQLRANLQLALGPGTALRPDRSLMDYLLFWQDWISYPGKLHATALLASIAFVLGLLGLYVRRRVLGRTALSLLVSTLILGISAVYDWYRFDQIERGAVIRREVIARKGNAESYGPAFTKPLTEGTEFRVLERRPPWLSIQLPGGQSGWVTEDTVVTF
jgi:hypothetical protein